LSCNNLQNRRKQPQSLSDQIKHTIHRRLCSNSQFRQRQQLAHSARNRAGQSIFAQEPAKSTTTTATVHPGSDRPSIITLHPSSLLFQLTVVEETTAGPQCSESCRSVDFHPSACNDNNKRPVQTNANIAHRCLCSNSQELKRRQLAHGVRNRAGQSILEQEPAESRRH
jgi:hypothetical protein